MAVSYNTGDVVWAPDPYHDNDPKLLGSGGRPWLVISCAAYPNHGRDYICCALTSYADSAPPLVPLGEDDWEMGHPPRPSQFDTETLLTIKHAWISRRVGRVSAAKANRARRLVKSYL